MRRVFKMNSFFGLIVRVEVSSLNNVFPKTLEILHERKIAYLREQFGKTLDEQLMLSSSSDTSRWFPVFLKFQGIRPEILEVAEFEYLRHLAKDFDMGKRKIDQAQLCLNPSLQFVELRYEQPKLNRSPGLYCFLKSNGQFLEYKMGISEALVVDLLQEERKYNREQLALMASQHVMGIKKGKSEWQNIIFTMLQVGILFCKEK